MEFSTLNEFIEMGGHGFYVWLSYGLTAIVILFNVIRPLRQRSQLVRQLQQQNKRNQRQQKMKQQSSKSEESNNAPAA